MFTKKPEIHNEKSMKTEQQQKLVIKKTHQKFIQTLKTSIKIDVNYKTETYQICPPLYRQLSITVNVFVLFYNNLRSPQGVKMRHKKDDCIQVYLFIYLLLFFFLQ